MNAIPIVYHDVMETKQRDYANLVVMQCLRAAGFHHALHHVDVYPGIISLHCSCGQCWVCTIVWPFPGPHRVSIGGVPCQRIYEPINEFSHQAGGRRYPGSMAGLRRLGDGGSTP